MSFTNNLDTDCHQRIRANTTKWSNNIGDYSMIAAIGKGSFGQVFKAVHKSADNNNNNNNHRTNWSSEDCHQRQQQQYCAIKSIDKKSSPNLGKILTEVSIHLRLKNDNILQLFNVIEDNQSVYLVLELCSGGTLGQLIQKYGGVKHYNNKNKKTTPPTMTTTTTNGLDNRIVQPVLDYRLISTIMKQLCNGLDYLHRNAIVHRDLNLNNILIVRSFDCVGELAIKIADFGLAIDLNTNSLQHLTKPHRDDHVMPVPIGTTICGTPGFISPEVWSQMQTVSAKSDIFSLGSILFSCIAGYTPKGALDLSNFSTIACDLICRLLAPDPNDRPTIDDIVKHQLIVGPLQTQRLHPISKITDSLELNINGDGSVFIRFKKKCQTIQVSPDGLNVVIASTGGSSGGGGCSGGQQQIKQKVYNYYSLPQNEWKKYNYAQKFVQLVRAKTPKVTVYPKNDDKSNNNNNNEYILKSSLMENSDFEVTIFNSTTNESKKVLINDFMNNNNNNNTLKLAKFGQRVKQLYEFCLKTEKDFQNSGDRSGIDCFPITFGRKSKIKSDSSTTTLSPSQISSQILRSIQIDGIGEASQLSNGVFNVCFTDGSTLSFQSDSEVPVIFYPTNGVEKRYRKNDLLPDFVKQKLALLPQIVNKLKESQQ
ncbi:serine/threonine-protein kinase PLK4-like [Oppia nitens]|uniref:serine/threonine-protein kinase PLK4-like n=1 Tax=Oppia nitens TaxID=1686743 RepID=UPI0023DC4B50|nr:serine/threonine-protein kinase PLK4-like [Oppia nitens]